MIQLPQPSPSHPKRLLQSFFEGLEVENIAENLLGKVLCTSFNGMIASGKIVETEAYRGPDDKACHAHNNRRTRRTEVMYGPSGVAYIYLCYGIHHLFNIVTGPEESAHAILIRAIEPIQGVEMMLSRRKMKKPITRLSAGPGALSSCLGINTKQTGMNLCSPESQIWLEDHGHLIRTENILRSPRVGVGYAEECADWLWRFRVADSSWTSPAK